MICIYFQYFWISVRKYSENLRTEHVFSFFQGQSFNQINPLSSVFHWKTWETLEPPLLLMHYAHTQVTAAFLLGAWILRLLQRAGTIKSPDVCALNAVHWGVSYPVTNSKHEMIDRMPWNRMKNREKQSEWPDRRRGLESAPRKRAENRKHKASWRENGRFHWKCLFMIFKCHSSETIKFHRFAMDITRWIQSPVTVIGDHR